MQTISSDTPHQHHRTFQLLRAATLVLVLAIAAFFVVDQLNDTGTDRSVTPRSGVLSSARAAVDTDGSFLDPAIFDQAVTGALTQAVPGGSAPGQASTTEPSFLDADVFNRALAGALGTGAASSAATSPEGSFLDADVFDGALAHEMAMAEGGSR